jgi:hypothetical protein
MNVGVLQGVRLRSLVQKTLGNKVPGTLLGLEMDSYDAQV